MTLVVLAVGVPAAQAQTPAYPDLKTLPPRDLRLDYTDVYLGSPRHVVRFTNTVWNAGTGALEVGGPTPTGTTSTTAEQVIYNNNGTVAAKHAAGSFTVHEEHQHYHYDDWARYELWTKAAFDKWVADGRPSNVGPDKMGTKTTVCMLDHEFMTTQPETPFPGVYPDAGCDASSGVIKSGISPGWGDTYDAERYDQWIILDRPLSDGDYVVRSVVDPDNLLYESPNKMDPLRDGESMNEGVAHLRIANGQVVDLAAPTGSATMNGVGATTSSSNVTLRVLGRDDVSGVDRVQVSNDGVTWREWTYTGAGVHPMSIAWDLADSRYGGTTMRGPRTVHVRFRDRAGRWGATVTDTIEWNDGTPGGGGSSSEYAEMVRSDGPISHWRLGETSGQTAVDQTGAHPGTYTGVALGQPGLLASELDRSARFSGSSHVSSPGTESLAGRLAVSAEAWIRPDSIPATGGWASVVTRPESFSLQFNGPRLEWTIIQNGVRRRVQAAAGAIQAGQTYHVLGTYDGASQRLYINGVQVGAMAVTGPTDYGYGMHIGSWDGYGEFFNGTIDEAAVYGHHLTGLQAKEHYDKGISGSAGVATPSNLAASAASSSQVNLTWTDNSSTETGFVVERDTTSAFTSPQRTTLAADVTSWQDRTVSGGTTYHYRVQAITATDSSAWSNVSSVSTPAAVPAAPSALAATAASASRIDLSWADNASGETGYVVERATNSTFTSPTAISLPAGATSYADTGRSASTTYWYRVRAVTGTVTSAWSNTASATTQAAPATAPAAPSALSATAASQTAINLAWTDNATDESGYVVERSTTSTFTSPTAITLPAGATSRQDTGLTAGTTYWYRVRAVNGALTSAWSNTASATTQSATTPPPAPTYASTVAADNPVSHWRLGETSGLTAADVRGVNPGTYRNGTLLGQTSLLANDTANRAVRVDGTNDDVRVNDANSLDFTTAFTLEAWIRPESIPTAGRWASVLSKAESYSLQFNGPLMEFTLIQNGTRQRLQAPAGAIAANRTYHVVATYDGANQRLYINGALVASRAQTGPASITTWPVTLGSWNGGETYRGSIDDVAVYGSTLPATRVQAHYSAGGSTTAVAARTARTTTTVLRNARVKPSRLGPAQRRTYARKGPGKPRTRPLPALR